MVKVLITHPRVRVAGKHLQPGEHEVDQATACKLIARKLATAGKVLEVATPKAEPKAKATPKAKPEPEKPE